jgi:hypothetical protein
MLGSIAIWQIIQIEGFLDPFRGWKAGLPQLVAALLFVLTYLLLQPFLKRIAKSRIKLWHIGVALTFLLLLLLASLNIVFDLRPEGWFLEARKTETRLHITLIFYCLFAINLAIVIALLNRLKPGG